ncbi:MAG: hypothetical protein A2430_00195 [Candidatus Liptonbacteria bacterium RIFOXYC1_FULL_36_8]|uniref:Uncharacterized protein n=2 Tax=Candidatus Liptoniibacteriota TaxID=1817909 RepID=A0A1G2CNN1_9BACT|nr:MAG: hypothetical protein A2390_01195 [Candidatus Liptonbacteria bacterium RIFOXYB1_FULL_36_10]OGZ03055.1 MAG: hypothetical protein A2430_00195 [Candidatus Liptonbacteria bacterium RIFOXYC1_FULL_36_8]
MIKIIKKGENKREKGQALIESIVAMGIIVTGVLGAFSFFSSSISLNRLVTNQYAATYKAASIIELYKHCIDVKGWKSDKAASIIELYKHCIDVKGCKSDCFSEALGEKQEKINGTNFTKSLIVDDTNFESKGYKIVKVNVEWQEKGVWNVNLEDRFYKWR